MTPESHPWSNRPVAEHVVHWDDIEPFRADEGAFQSTWTDLGRAAGSVTVGVKRVRVEPGARSTPLHMEGSEEETFFVLDGSGLSWQDDGDGDDDLRDSSAAIASSTSQAPRRTRSSRARRGSTISPSARARRRSTRSSPA